MTERSTQPPGPTTGPDDERGDVDVSLIRWMLSLTPAERLAVLEDQVNAILELRGRN